jgi:hypothetical protein
MLKPDVQTRLCACKSEVDIKALEPKLAPVLTEENRETLLPRAIGKSKREIAELVAELSPKPDVRPSMRKLPERRNNKQPTRHELGLDRAIDQVSEPSSVPAPVSPAVVEPISPASYKVHYDL